MLFDFLTLEVSIYSSVFRAFESNYTSGILIWVVLVSSYFLQDQLRTIKTETASNIAQISV